MIDGSAPSHLRLAFDWIDSQLPQTCEAVLRWCRQNSWSMNASGLAAMSDLLVADFDVLDLPVERVDLAPWKTINESGGEQWHPSAQALLWYFQPQSPRRALLLIHYDTVYPPSDDPVPTVLDSPPDTSPARLRGPGVADAKGGIAVIRLAMQAIRKFDLAGELGLTVVLNPDEEVGSPASASLFERLAPEFEFALVFEPALPDGSMVTNRKGTANFTAVVRGRSAHAGRNLNQGRNAVVHAAKLAIELDQWNRSRDFLPTSSAQDDLTINVGKIIGGGPLNQVPDLATLGFNVRVRFPQDVDAVLAQLKAIERRYSSDEGYTCEIHGHFHSPPKRIDELALFDALRKRVAAAAALAGRQVRWCDTGGACDGNKLAALGLPNIDTMGPIGGNLHSNDEYCEAGSLATAAKTVVALIAAEGRRIDE